MEVPGIFFFFSKYILYFFSLPLPLSTCFQNNHFIQSIQWKKESVKSVARFPVDKTNSWLTRCFTYQLFVLALFRHSLCLFLFSLYWVCSNCFCIIFFGILLASSFHFWLFKQFYLQTHSSIDLYDMCSKWFSTKYMGYLSWYSKSALK